MLEHMKTMSATPITPASSQFANNQPAEDSVEFDGENANTIVVPTSPPHQFHQPHLLSPPQPPLNGHAQQPTAEPAAHQEAQARDSDNSTSLSPCEARVAGVYHEDGCVASVHGLAGIMNPTLRATHRENISKISRRGDMAISMTQARLISNAALQRQYETAIFRNPSKSIDTDGCDLDLAKHLLDLHFNRHDYPNLILYRPAVMGSIGKPGGPWVNKLLLNAIFYSSALCSDRDCFQSNRGPQDKGLQFYDRFRQLLVDEMGQASIPTATALLLMSTTLIARGKISEGWNMSGMAYRMVIDLGCHLMLALDYETVESRSSRYNLHRDMEREMRKRLYWGAYVTDVTQSLFLGRPCMFANVEARVPLLFLDTFEELDEWQPYNDPLAGISLVYKPQAAHAISTFTSLVRLATIGKMVSDLYDIAVMKNDTKSVLNTKASIEQKLEEWSEASPKHLQPCPEHTGNSPPPHQITPHTTFHVLRILLYRAFMEEGHLRRHSDVEMKRQCEDYSKHSALMITEYVQAYRESFSLRRAPFLFSYAVYSAATVALRQERYSRGQFIESIPFLWKCLGELQEGCNFGLQRPMAILRDTVHEFYQSTRAALPENIGPTWPGDFDKSIFSNLPMEQNFGAGSGISPLSLATWSDGFSDCQTALDQSQFGLDQSFLTNDEWTISQNDLYGLFAL
ncbi:hypothetical protein N0V90_005900 [Kalmusia sp. IMI 367209]|nr:hypothetical protein N0V90_005900 [Kalmusia sp. IMI 367209]